MITIEIKATKNANAFTQSVTMNSEEIYAVVKTIADSLQQDGYRICRISRRGGR